MVWMILTSVEFSKISSMNKIQFALISTLFLAISCLRATEIEKNFYTGFQDGVCAQGGVTFWDFAEGFPLGVEVSLAYANTSPGNALYARSVFINDNTNGTPDRSSRLWNFRADLLYPVEIRGIKFNAIGGMRYGLYTAHFHFVGANEEFDVTSDQWGIGFGLKKDFPINERYALVVQAGFDYYFDSALEGHDTIYYPDNQNVNSRRDYDFDDASKAANQPGFIPVLMVGVSF